MVKVTLRSAFHLGHSTVTCVSLQLHLSFACSFLLHTSFTCGSLDQRSVNQMLHNWLCRAWRLASTEHKLIHWFSAKVLPILVSLISFQCLSFLSMVSSQTQPGHFPCWKPTVWPTTELRRPTLMPLPIISYLFLCLVRQLASFFRCYSFLYTFL